MATTRIDDMSAQEARSYAERVRNQVARMRKAASTATENASAVAWDVGHELVGYATLDASSFAAGYFGQDKLAFLGVDFRPVVGGLLQLAGFGALLFGYPAGRWAVSGGRGFLASWMAERLFVAGHKFAHREEKPAPPATVRGNPPIADNHPMWDSTPARDVHVTRVNRFATT